MKITVATNAGFCFGVKRATDRLEEALAQARAGETIATLGHLIHNESYNEGLRRRGVLTVSDSDLPALAAGANAEHPVTVLVRAHGCTKETEELLNRYAAENPYFRPIDCTCPYVKKIHRIAKENSAPDKVLLLIGSETHPEVVGILSWFEGEKYVFPDAQTLNLALMPSGTVRIDKKTPVMVAQTTLNLVNWNECQKKLKSIYTNAIIFDTICRVTEERQSEAKRLARDCDLMLVIGGRESSNTAKLAEICRSACPQTLRIASAAEWDRRIPTDTRYVGIVAGASTPRNEIEEVYKTMSEMNENFEKMLDETQCVTLNTGDVVTGTVTQVSDAELQLDLGAGVTGYIKAEQISDDPAFKLTEQFKKGDSVEAFVIRVSDLEGVAELSKKRVDADRNWKNIEEACENKTVLEGKVAEAVKGGVVIYTGANRVFIPASQSGVPKDGDLSTLVGETVKFRIIEVKPGKKAIGSIRLVQREERREKEAEFWANIEVGKVYTGVVKSTTSYGAFVDLGCGVDGMVHLTELSWKHIRKPEDVVTVGEPLTVYVKSFDPEKKRISLGYKTEESNPWNIFRAQYAIGDVASVKIVSLMPFGAFAEIIDGVDGLIHISQIALQRIAKPSDVLEVGQVVDARIIDIDDEHQKVSLSIRSLLEDEMAAAEAMPEDYAVDENETM